MISWDLSKTIVEDIHFFLHLYSPDKQRNPKLRAGCMSEKLECRGGNGPHRVTFRQD